MSVLSSHPSRIVDSVVDWILSLGHDQLSVIISIIALVVAVWTTVVSRRSAKATENQATATAKQVDIAQEQSESAREQAWSASIANSQAQEIAEVEAIQTVKAWVDDRSPKLCVSIHKISPGVHDPGMVNPPVNWEELKEWTTELEFWEHQGDLLYFAMQGVIYNDGTESIRVLPAGPQFLAGTVVGYAGEFSVPRKADPQSGYYLLKPGQAALFETLKVHTFDNWLMRSDRNHPSTHVSTNMFACAPASADDPKMEVLIDYEGDPVVRSERKAKGLIVDTVMPAGYPSMELSIDYQRHYPESFKEIQARLTDDRWALGREMVDRYRRNKRQ